jgi:hypothetical protein
MKVFISWSGPTSRAAAEKLRDWLPSVMQFVDPYMSSEDIQKGTRWSADIAKVLNECDYGIVCMTKSNAAAPWLNFEAGALSKAVDIARVAPFLFRLEPADLPSGPLSQFQSTVVDRDDVLRLVKALNEQGGAQALEDARLETAFDKWWPELEAELSQIPAEKSVGKPKHRPTEDVLNEVLELVRTQQQVLNSPERLLPIDYIHYAMDRARDSDTRRLVHDSVDPDAIEAMVRAFDRLTRSLSRRAADPDIDEIIDHVSALGQPLEYVASRVDLRSRSRPLMPPALKRLDRLMHRRGPVLFAEPADDAR